MASFDETPPESSTVDPATFAPATEWRATSGLVEYGSSGISDIVDVLGNNLVDTLGNNIVNTGVTATSIPATIWEQDNSI